MTPLDAMKQALEALERGPWTLVQKEQYNNAITNLRAAIEQMEKQEPDKTKIEMVIGAIHEHMSIPLYPREVAAAAQYIVHRYCSHPAPAVPEMTSTERSQTVTMLRSICEAHGDNDWPDDLHLADVIDKHLWRHIDNHAPAVQEKQELGFNALCNALVGSRVVDYEAVHDADSYDDGIMIGRIKSLHERLIQQHPAPAVPEGTCNWYEGDDGGPWATQCNELFNIENEGPEANGMKFCCFCGKKLVEVVSEDCEDETS